MAIEIILEGTLKPSSNQEKFTAFLEHFCHHRHLKFEDYGTICLIEICPEGIIECSYENDFVSILAQTNVVGPGFHAYAADLLEALMEESDVELEASDPTGYMDDHDFEKLKYDYFYTWLSSVAAYVQDHEDLEHLCIAWPLHYYRPQEKQGAVITPMGYILVQDFAKMDIEELADRFFIWNEQGMHAGFYRSCALNLIWKECYFEYSAMNEYTYKTASAIMDYLEIAYEKDPMLPLPLGVYRLLAKVIKREDLLLGAYALPDEEMGYRRHPLQYELKDWRIPVDGCCEIYQDQEQKSAQINNGYHHEEEVWHWMLQLDIQEKGTYDAVFFEESPFIIQKKKLHAASLEGYMITLNYGEHYEIFAQLIAGTEQLLVRYRTMEEDYLEKGREIIEGICFMQTDDDGTMRH